MEPLPGTGENEETVLMMRMEGGAYNRTIIMVHYLILYVVVINTTNRV